MKISSVACLSAFALIFLCYDVAAKEENHQGVVFTRALADNEYGNYHVAVLQAALNATSELGTTTLVPHPQPMSQSRQLVSLIKSEADVMQSATSKVREKQLIPIFDDFTTLRLARCPLLIRAPHGQSLAFAKREARKPASR